MGRSILLYPDPRLVAANPPVTSFDQGLDELVEEMFRIAARVSGLGLAAPQIGCNLRLAVVDLTLGDDRGQRLVLANPELVGSEGRLALEEGCLSFPGLYTTITRPRSVEVRALDREGNPRLVRGEGLLAQAICHELDHLDGVLLVDHLRGLKRRLFLRRVERMRRLGVWPRQGSAPQRPVGRAARGSES